MKLWQKDITINKTIERFTVGQDNVLDLRLAPFDILGSLAHIKMLTSIGLLEEAELQALTTTLQGLYQKAVKGDFVIEDGIEDVHSQVELLLTQALGDVGKKIHSGRSRNDQVLVDLRLYFRKEVETLASDTKTLFDTLLQLSETYKNVLMPGYTHTQVAMVSSFGLWFGAYAEGLVEDMRQLLCSYQVINQNPLGSAAGYGSSFPLNRTMTTELLGFADLSYNVVQAQMGRGKTELSFSFAMASIAHTLGKLAADICLFINQNFDFISFPDELTTGSSIMPHKKNPDVFELIRARCNQLMTLPQEISMMTSNLTVGYHRDFQLLKESVFPAIENLKDCLQIATFALQQIKINTAILEDKKYDYLYTVEVVNDLVVKGVPFRDAYKAVGQAVENGQFSYDGTIQHTHEGSLGNLCNDKIAVKMDKIIQQFDFDKVNASLKALLQ